MGILDSLLKTAVEVVTLPVAIAKDVVTLGGALIDEESATVEKAERIVKNVEEGVNSLIEPFIAGGSIAAIAMLPSNASSSDTGLPK